MYLKAYLKSKIHRATVTKADLNYNGSCSIDKELMSLANIDEYEQIHIYNINNGKRFVTYAIAGDIGEIIINGAGARYASPGDKIIICAYCICDYSVTPIELKVNEYNELYIPGVN